MQPTGKETATTAHSCSLRARLPTHQEVWQRHLLLTSAWPLSFETRLWAWLLWMPQKTRGKSPTGSDRATFKQNCDKGSCLHLGLRVWVAGPPERRCHGETNSQAQIPMEKEGKVGLRSFGCCPFPDCAPADFPAQLPPLTFFQSLWQPCFVALKCNLP